MGSWNPTIKSTVVDGNIESVYLVFDGVERCVETTHFVRHPDGARCLVDIGQDDLPIAIQFAMRIPLDEIEKQPAITAEQFQEIINHLYGFASQLIVCHNKAKKRDLTRKALEQARAVAAYSRKAA